MKNVSLQQSGFPTPRRTTGVILHTSDKRIFIEFVVSDFKEEDGFLPFTIRRWFKRKSRLSGGIYRATDMDYWYIRKG